MSNIKDRLGDPRSLAAARAVAHAGVQPLSKVARANLPAASDDSHSNLEWSPKRQMFLTHTLCAGDGQFQIGLSVAPLCLAFLRNGERLEELTLTNQSMERAEGWIDDGLVEIGLKTTSSVRLPYSLPKDVSDIESFGEDTPGLATLAAWFTLAADTLQALATDVAELEPGPGDVRCWPHHFDIATYVGLEPGDFETAKGIGVGLSPGDDTYDQPYFYVNPWPHPDLSTLPDPIAPGHWHTDGFIGSIATGTEVLSAPDTQAGTAQFLRASFNAGRTALGG